MKEKLEDEVAEIEPVVFDNTVELSSNGFCQEMVQEMNRNQLKISKLKLKNKIEQRKQIKAYLKKNLLTNGTKEKK